MSTSPRTAAESKRGRRLFDHPVNDTADPLSTELTVCHISQHLSNPDLYAISLDVGKWVVVVMVVIVVVVW